MSPREIERIKNPDDLAAFIMELKDDYLICKDNWENWTIPDYLDSIAAWIRDYTSCPNNDIDWDKVDLKVIARILYVGKIYE